MRDEKRSERKNKKNLDELMRAALAVQAEPVDEMNRNIIRQWREQTNMKKSSKRKMTMAVTAACLLLMTVSAAAAARYLSLQQIAEESGQEIIISAFRGKDALELNESKEAGDYVITLLGVASGEALIQSPISEAIPELGGTYAALAIERKDGQPMPSTSDEAYGQLQFFASPLIQGLSPWEYNIASMNGGYQDTVVEGILYRLIECDDIAMFADRKLYLCVTDTFFYDNTAYQYDANTGEIQREESYEGINVLFDLPLDAARADQAGAEAYLKALQKSWEPSEEPESKGPEVTGEGQEEILNEILSEEAR